MNEILDFPPFPQLTFNHIWTARVELKTWRGFRQNPDCWDETRMGIESDGSVILYVISSDYKDAPPTPEQSAAYQFLIDSEEVVYQAVLQGLYEEYPSRRAAYDLDEEDVACMPELKHPDEFKKLIGLSAISILRTARDGIAYVRFDLGAAWDPEHGFNITMHKDRVVRVGDTGAGEYYAKDDAKLA